MRKDSREALEMFVKAGKYLDTWCTDYYRRSGPVSWYDFPNHSRIVKIDRICRPSRRKIVLHQEATKRFASLPTHVKHHILSYIDTIDLVSAAYLVCWEWRYIINQILISYMNMYALYDGKVIMDIIALEFPLDNSPGILFCSHFYITYLISTDK